MLFKEKLNLYKKDDLKAFADDIGLTKLSKMKKAELVELVAARLLDPDVMFYRLSIFDDKAIEIFEKGIGRFYRFTDEERDTVSILNEMDLAVVGKDDAGEDIVFVFDDVAEVWQGVKNEKFEAYRKRGSKTRNLTLIGSGPRGCGSACTGQKRCTGIRRSRISLM